MAEQHVTFPVLGPDDTSLTLEGVLELPEGEGPHAGVVVAHPHPLRGGSMDNTVVDAICRGAHEAGIATLRFNFRGVGASEGVHDNGEGELADVQGALGYLAVQPGVDAERLGLAGYSFGARVALRAGHHFLVQALLCVAPPMREPLPGPVPTCPTLVLVGDQDQVAGGDLDRYRMHLPEPEALQVVAGADHFWWGFEHILTSAARTFFDTVLNADAAPPMTPLAGLPPGVLDRANLERLLDATPPLVEGLLDPAGQLQQNGIDLTVADVAWLATVGQIGVSNDDRVLPEPQAERWDANGWMHLAPGPYLVTANETLHTPRDLTVLLWPRSSLLRSGVAVHTAVVDAGYEGRPQFLLSVLNPHGFRLQRNARIVQMVAFTLIHPVEQGYHGHYQGK